jgi:hypothetical protein
MTSDSQFSPNQVGRFKLYKTLNLQRKIFNQSLKNIQSEFGKYLASFLR